jgi:para-nitrobenzyl esterase
MTRLGLAIAAVLLLSTQADAAPVATESGAVEGVRAADVTVYKGIPFAAAPVGPLRWRPPAPPTPWTGVRIADRFSPTCMQPGAYPADAPAEPMSEDCLYLNLWAPAGATPDAKLPVMVWIHGGGFLNGSASTPLYAGDELARRGVIVVTANYRLGALGFLAHPELTRESPNAVSGNYGLLDQLAALAWVKRNIVAFGGDAQNVTLFGQSSGSISISVLSVSPLARGLFQRAIGQSGGLFEPVEVAAEFWLRGAENQGAAFAAKLGAHSIEDLRAKPATDILAAGFAPNPVIDGHLLREPPFDALAARRGNDVDLLIGSNADEGLDFLGERAVTVATLPELLRRDFPPFIVWLIGPKAPANDAEAFSAYVAFQGNLRFGWDMLAWARLHAGAGRGKTFLYHFAHVPPGEAGSRHGVEMAYAFGHANPRAPWREVDRALSDTMARYWTNYAKTGDPNAPGLPSWPSFELGREEALLISADTRPGSLPNAAELAPIGRLYATVRFVFGTRHLLAGAASLLVLLTLGALWRPVRKRSQRSE